jgi:hypothetical protein
MVVVSAHSLLLKFSPHRTIATQQNEAAPPGGDFRRWLAIPRQEQFSHGNWQGRNRRADNFSLQNSAVRRARRW